MTKKHRGMLTVIWLFVLALLVACESGVEDDNQTPAPAPAPAPLLTKWTDASGDDSYFGGFLYPGVMPGTYELDVPLETLAGTRYYASEFTAQVEQARYLELAWINGDGAEVPVSSVEGPCDPQEGGAARQFMHSNSLRYTGMKTSASYDLVIDSMLDDGDIVYWITCEPENPGEVINYGDEGGIDSIVYHVAVLMPDSQLSEGGQLRVISRRIYTAGPPVSNPLELTIVKSPIMIAVVGDSVAWGQGIGSQSAKYWGRFLNEIVQDWGSARIQVEAHSGAIINRDNDPSNIADVNPGGCNEDRQFDGEIPRQLPTIQCQILATVTRACTVTIGANNQPQFDCSNDAAGNQIEINIGPRYDYVLADGCINDVGAVFVHLGDGTITGLHQRIIEQCDLFNGLADIRAYYPNAAITISGYHLTVSDFSMRASGCTHSVPAAIPFGGDFYPVAAVIHYQEEIADRALFFRDQSNIQLQNSVSLLANSGEGRGTIIFVPYDFFNAPNAAFGPAPFVFGLDCSDPFMGAVDPAREDRYIDCREWANAKDLPTTSPAEEFCKRASAFHPNPQGNNRMFLAIRRALVEADYYPPES